MTDYDGKWNKRRREIHAQYEQKLAPIMIIRRTCCGEATAYDPCEHCKDRIAQIAVLIAERNALLNELVYAQEVIRVMK